MGVALPYKVPPWCQLKSWVVRILVIREVWEAPSFEEMGS